LCLRDGRRARRLAGPALRWFYGELLRVTAPVLEQLLPSYEHLRNLGRFRRLLHLSARLPLLELAGLVIVGTPEQCIERMSRLREAGVTHLLCSVGAGALPTHIVRESLECLSGEVLPVIARLARA
jgi:alkanesulfonate monooxygenase SsuD/methylene tetrahydromethanopterin reductase-like flavin-dependent oxidoreductase (luciferase family)